MCRISSGRIFGDIVKVVCHHTTHKIISWFIIRKPLYCKDFVYRKIMSFRDVYEGLLNICSPF
jgi:hypothetical protein